MYDFEMVLSIYYIFCQSLYAEQCFLFRFFSFHMKIKRVFHSDVLPDKSIAFITFFHFISLYYMCITFLFVQRISSKGKKGVSTCKFNEINFLINASHYICIERILHHHHSVVFRFKGFSFNFL